jgi:hypothetical protein
LQLCEQIRIARLQLARAALFDVNPFFGAANHFCTFRKLI